MAIHCILCESPSSSMIELRSGNFVCTQCIDSREVLINKIAKRIAELKNKKPPASVWGVLGVLNIFIFGIMGFYLPIAIKIESFIITLIVWGIGIWLSGYFFSFSVKTNETIRASIQNQIERLTDELRSKQDILRNIYKDYWDYPPDWEWRKNKVIERDGQCRQCGRPLNSNVPFHVHHTIPKSKPNGNHSLDNLALHCEICHSKKPGHEFMEIQRKRRFVRNKF